MADMGKECAAFVCRKYPDDGYFKLAALGIKCRGIEWSESLTGSTEERVYAADEVLCAFDECFRGGESIPAFALNVKHWAHYTLGDMAIKMNDRADAMKHYKKALGCLHSSNLGENDFDMMQLQMKIAIAQCVLRDGDVTVWETLLPFFRAIFQKSKEEYGEDNYGTLSNGKALADTLYKLGRFDEVKVLIPDLHTRADRVLGPSNLLMREFTRLKNKVGALY